MIDIYQGILEEFASRASYDFPYKGMLILHPSGKIRSRGTRGLGRDKEKRAEYLNEYRLSRKDNPEWRARRAAYQRERMKKLKERVDQQVSQPDQPSRE